MSMKTFANIVALANFRLVACKTALLVIDVQDCFLESQCTTSGQDGSLAVPACDIIPKINSLRANKTCLFDEVIFTQDYHPANHISFGSSHGLAPFSHLGGQGELQLTCLQPGNAQMADAACCPTTFVNASAIDCSTQLCPPSSFDYTVDNSGLVSGNSACSTCQTSPDQCYQTGQAMWTDHCVQTGDSNFPPSLDKQAGDLVVQKGMNQYVDAYSGFMDNTQNLQTELDSQLQAQGITTLYVVGIATDVCVKWTVRDALSSLTASYSVTVVTDATAAVQGDVNNFNAAIAFMENLGATTHTTAEVLAMECPATDGTEVSGSVSKSMLTGILFAIFAMCIRCV